MATHATISQAKGSSGAEVTLWQQLLNSHGQSVAVSGTFDTATTAATKAWQAANGLGADGIVGAMSWAKMTGEAQTPPPGGGYVEAYGKKAAFGRDSLLAAWPAMIAEAKQSKYPEVVALAEKWQGGPSLSAIQIFQAMAQLESGYGLASYKGPNGSKVLNNWGAIQAGQPDASGNCPAGSFLVGDSGANGAYVFCYRDYPTPEAGALDFLRALTIKRPTSWAIADTGDVDAYSIQMHSWTPPLTALGQGHAGKTKNLDPITKMPGYFEQPPIAGNNSRAKGLIDRANSIAVALDEPLEVQRGGPYEGGGEGGGDSGGGGGILGGNSSLVGWAIAALAVVGGGYAAWKSGLLRGVGLKP